MDKYYRYQLTFPYEGNKIYRSKSHDKAIKKCYQEFKQLNISEKDKTYSIFGVTNLDKNIEYKFQMNQNEVNINTVIHK